MTTPRSSWPLNLTGNVTLDGSGNGTVQLRPDGPQEHWSLSLASFKTGQTVITNEAQCRIYIGPQVADQYFVDGTLSGSTGDSTGKVANGYDIFRTGPLPSVWAVWTGGDPGAIATLSISGTASFGQGGGNFFSSSGEGCSNPIIGGGGALVYPSIHSPNYSAGPPVTGWTINKDGSFSFGSGGSITGTLKIYNSHGAVIFEVEPSKDAWFLYKDTGSAVQGALVASGASANTTDDFGNTVKAGVVAYITVASGTGVGTYAVQLADQANPYAHFAALSLQNLTHPANLPPAVVGQVDTTQGAALQIQSGKLALADAESQIQLTDNHATQASITLVADAVTVTPIGTSTGFQLTGTITLEDQASSPAAVIGGLVLWADSKGFLRFTADSNSGDPTVYEIGAAHLITTANQPITSAVQVDITSLGITLGIGKYRIRGHLTIVQGGTAQVIAIGCDGTVTAANLRLSVYSGGSATSSNMQFGFQLTAMGSRGSLPQSYAAGATIDIQLDGVINVSAAGTFNLNAGSAGGALAFTVQAFSTADFEPAI